MAVPAVPRPVFVLVASPPRASWHDVWITRDGSRPEDLPAGAMVGTASLRRQGQILALCPQLEVKTVRGNVQTRLGRLDEGDRKSVVQGKRGGVGRGGGSEKH